MWGSPGLSLRICSIIKHDREVSSVYAQENFERKWLQLSTKILKRKKNFQYKYKQICTHNQENLVLKVLSKGQKNVFDFMIMNLAKLKFWKFSIKIKIISLFKQFNFNFIFNCNFSPDYLLIVKTLRKDNT